MPGRREPAAAVGHSFVLEVAGVQVATLSEVTGLGTERDVIELREGGADGRQVTRKLPGNLKPGEVVLSRALSTDHAFEDWMRDVATDAARARRDVVIAVLDRHGRRVTSFALKGAWPRRLEYTGLRAGPDEPLTEALVLVHDGVDRT